MRMLYTILLDVDVEILHAFMTCIGEAGAQHGLAFSWSRLEALPVRTEVVVRKLDGHEVEMKGRMVYMGSPCS